MTTREFGRWLEEGGCEAKTVGGYCRDVGLLERWGVERGAWSELRPGRMTRVEASAWLHLLQDEGQVAATVNRKLAALRAFVRWGMETGELVVDPLERVEGVKSQAIGPDGLEAAEEGRIERELELARNGARSAFEQMTGARDAAVYFLLRYCGLRVAELCALKIGDVEMSPRSGGVTVRHGKGNKERWVPMPREARWAVLEWLKVRPQAMGDDLFIGKRGEALTPSGVQRRLAEIGRRARVGLHPHLLRHTCAHWLLESGATMAEVQAWLGHERLETTQIYTQATRRGMRQLAERLA